jgi:hypothetical protein
MYLLPSTDGGNTWADDRCLWDGSADETSYSYSVTNLARLSGGDLVLSGLRAHRPRPDIRTLRGEHSQQAHAARKRAERQSRTTAKLRHPHAHGQVVDDGGAALRVDRFHRRPAALPDRVSGIGQGVAGALHNGNSRGTRPGSIKGENCLNHRASMSGSVLFAAGGSVPEWSFREGHPPKTPGLLIPLWPMGILASAPPSAGTGAERPWAATRTPRV